jgi:hypothetical protein
MDTKVGIAFSKNIVWEQGSRFKVGNATVKLNILLTSNALSTLVPRKFPDHFTLQKEKR